MTLEEQISIRYMCKGCIDSKGDIDPCYFHTEKYAYLGAPHNCLFSPGPGKWHPQILVDGTWMDTSEDVLTTALDLLEEDP